MKNLSLLLLGIFLTVAFSFTGIVLISNIQYGKLTPIAMEEEGDQFPQAPVGTAQQGKQVYIDLGCSYCHTQQVRRKGYGTDYERGWGDRQSVPRDYIQQDRVLLGTMRTGPDLMNVGIRLASKDWHMLHLYDSQITSPGSVMPSYGFLFEKKKIEMQPSVEALQFPSNYPKRPEAGYEIVPTERAKQLVDYLLSLKLDYELPESKFVKE
jgi:cytochrome c oxidase cbb3-type subunit II